MRAASTTYPDLFMRWFFPKNGLTTCSRTAPPPRCCPSAFRLLLRWVGPLWRPPPRCALGPPLRGGSLRPSLAAAGAGVLPSRLVHELRRRRVVALPHFVNQ